MNQLSESGIGSFTVYAAFSVTSTYGELGTILIGLPGILESKKMNVIESSEPV